MEVRGRGTIHVAIQAQHCPGIVILRVNIAGYVSQRVYRGDVAAECRRLSPAGVTLKPGLKEEGFRCEAQDETAAGECVPDIPEGPDCIEDSRGRWIAEVI